MFLPRSRLKATPELREPPTLGAVPTENIGGVDGVAAHRIPPSKIGTGADIPAPPMPACHSDLVRPVSLSGLGVEQMPSTRQSGAIKPGSGRATMPSNPSGQTGLQ
jgi:hypothetical protein